MEQGIQFSEIMGVGVVGEVLNVSGYQKKILTVGRIDWRTRFEADQQCVVTSSEYVTDQGTDNESVWRIELESTQVIDGERYMSAYVRLVKTQSADAVVTCIYSIHMHTTTDFSMNEENLYTKRAGLTQFSKDAPKHGFSKFIPQHLLGPFAKAGNHEKMEFIVILSILTNDPDPEPPVETLQTYASELPLFYNHGAPLRLDTKLKFEREFISVDSERVSYYTSYFEDYYIKEGDENSPRAGEHLTLEFETKALLLKIIEFCHSGKLQAMPKRWTGLCRMLKKVTELGIIQLKSDLQIEIMKRMNPETFTDVVNLTDEGTFDYRVAYPFLYDYLINNLAVLMKEETYKETFDENKKIYAAMMVYCNP